MMEEKADLEREIEKLKTNLAAYLQLAPLLEVSEKEKERVTNQFLDDILIRRKKLKQLQ